MQSIVKVLSVVLLLTFISQSQAMFTRNLGNLSRFMTKRLSPIQGRFSAPSNTWFSKPWVRRAALFGTPTVAAATTAYVGASIGNDMLQESRCETRLAQHKLDEIQTPFHGLPTSYSSARSTIHFKAKGFFPVVTTKENEDAENFKAFGKAYGKCISAPVYQGTHYHEKLTGPCLTVNAILNNNIAQQVANGKLLRQKTYYPFLEDARKRIGNAAALTPFLNPDQYKIKDLNINISNEPTHLYSPNRNFEVAAKIQTSGASTTGSPEAYMLKRYSKEFSQCMKDPRDKYNPVCNALKTPEIKAGMPNVKFEEFDVDVTFDAGEYDKD